MSVPAPAKAAAPPRNEDAEDQDWTEKYRPRSLKDIVGNGKAVGTIQEWAQAWTEGIPKKRALVLEGTPGIGKTSAAHALARDRAWDLIELNASDARSAPIIQRVAGQGARTNTFGTDGSFQSHDEGRRTLIVLDEADNLFERGGAKATSQGEDLSDRGGKRAIVETVRDTRQPIILIVNDYYGLTKGSGAALRTLAETVKFQRVPARSVAKALAGICKAEGIKAHPDALLAIAENASGDLRAAVNDLQAAARGKTQLVAKDFHGSARDTSRTVFDALPDVFKHNDVDRARRATYDIDENPENFILWIDENIPHAYTDPGDLARAFEALARADIYLGRVRRRQYYGLWSYASQMMTAGVAVAKHRQYRGWTRYQFPSWLRTMSSSRGKRALRDGLAKKLGRHMHTSIREARTEYLEPVSSLMRADEEFAVALGADLRLSNEELGLLLDTKPDTKRVTHVAEQIAAELERRPKEHAGIWTSDDAAEVDPEEAKPSKRKVATKRPPTASVEEDDDPAEDEPEKPSAPGGKTLFDF